MHASTDSDLGYLLAHQENSASGNPHKLWAITISLTTKMEPKFNLVRFQIFKRKFWNSPSPSPWSTSPSIAPRLHAGLVLHWNLQAHFSSGTSNFTRNAGKFWFFRTLIWKGCPVLSLLFRRMKLTQLIRLRSKSSGCGFAFRLWARRQKWSLRNHRLYKYVQIHASRLVHLIINCHTSETGWVSPKVVKFSTSYRPKSKSWMSDIDWLNKD